MKFSYDPEHNVAYIRLGKKQTGVETIKISDELNVDMAPDGKIYGIELLNATEQLKQEDRGNLVFVNEATGHQTELNGTL